MSSLQQKSRIFCNQYSSGSMYFKPRRASCSKWNASMSGVPKAGLQGRFEYSFGFLRVMNNRINVIVNEPNFYYSDRKVRGNFTLSSCPITVLLANEFKHSQWELLSRPTIKKKSFRHIGYQNDCKIIPEPNVSYTEIHIHQAVA